MESGSQQYVFSMESDGYQLSRLVACILITSSVGKIVQDVIQTSVVNETYWDAVRIRIGSFVIGGMIAEKVWTDTVARMDRFHQTYRKVRKDWEDAEPVNSKAVDVEPEKEK